jgi:hypothetical protein
VYYECDGKCSDRRQMIGSYRMRNVLIWEVDEYCEDDVDKGAG